MRRIHLPDGREAPGPRIIVHVRGTLSKYRNTLDGASRRWTYSNQHAPAVLHILQQRILEDRGHRHHIRQHHKRILRRIDIRRLLHINRLQHERRLRSSSQRCAKVKLRPRIARLVHKQHSFRIGPLHRKAARIVRRETVRRVDPAPRSGSPHTAHRATRTPP